VLGDSTAVGYARVLQQTHYYPFGMRMSQISTPLTTTGNDYLYNGKQYQDDFNLNWYDYGARFYDPALGRWHSVDPLAEVYYDWSPYNYVMNNPISQIDPDGMSVASITSTFVDEHGKIIEYRNDGDPTIYIVPNPENWNGEKEGLAVYGYEKPGVEYGRNIGNNIDNVGYIPLDPRVYPFDPPIEQDYTIESILIPAAFAGKIYKGLRSLSQILKAGGKNLTKIKDSDLNPSQLANLKRFQGKIPSNSKNTVEIVRDNSGNVIFRATSPGKVPGSQAVYEKMVNGSGKTVGYVKTTYDNVGNLVHAKNKF